jgi:hypothetical protein
VKANGCIFLFFGQLPGLNGIGHRGVGGAGGSRTRKRFLESATCRSSVAMAARSVAAAVAHCPQLLKAKPDDSVSLRTIPPASKKG